MAKLFRDGQVAVVTGAAQGIGKAACEHFAAEGMSVCLVDLPGEALEAAADAIPSALAIPADLSKPDDIYAMHGEVMAKFGKVNLLLNNAVTRTGRGMDAPIGQWREAMEVNFWSAVEAARLFLPAMLASGERGLIVNAGSKQGITNPPGHPVSNITKSALKTYTEALEHDLRQREGNEGEGRVSAHLLIPGWTKPGGADHPEGAWLPEQVVEFMCAGLERGDFYLLCPDNETTSDMDRRRIAWAAGDIAENRPPLSRWHPDYAAEAKDACG